MKLMLFAALLCIASLSFCLQVSPYGPQADALTYANFQDTPLSIGGIQEQQYGIFIDNGNAWDFYQSLANGLPVKGIIKLNDTTMLVAMGANSYSDGVYNFNLDTHVWSINYWFMSPNFLSFNPNNSTYYVGERDGLYKSVNGTNWSRVTSIGINRCSSIAFFGTNIVTNNSSFVKYSTDNGQSWQTANTSNLRGFYYTSSGTLYAIMDVESDSDGLWRSDDNGATWNCVYFTSHLNCIGPDYGNQLLLGWSEANGDGAYVALIDQQYQLTNLQHENLDSGVRQQDIFPLVNTPSFFVLNAEGCFFVTSFLPVENDDESFPVKPELSISAYPNPFYSQTTIRFNPNHKQDSLNAEIYNLKGQFIRSLAGSSPFVWDGRDEAGRIVGSGVYLLKVSDGRQTITHKILKIK